jgi:hypothetical protein
VISDGAHDRALGDLHRGRMWRPAGLRRTFPGCGVAVVVDMRPYEFQGELAEVIYADLTGDDIVGLDDFDTLLNCWSSSDEPCCLADLDLDGNVSVVDFLILLANWGP